MARIDEITAQIDMLPRYRSGNAAKIFQRIGPGRSVGDQRFLKRFARIQRFQLAQFAIAGTHHIRGAAQHTAPLNGSHPRPCFLRALPGCYSTFDNGGGGGVNMRDHLTSHRINVFYHSAAYVFHIASIDEMAGLRLRTHHQFPGHPDSRLGWSIIAKLYDGTEKAR